jgi:hypothetical protein
VMCGFGEDWDGVSRLLEDFEKRPIVDGYRYPYYTTVTGLRDGVDGLSDVDGG